jgi:hypothetical protein
MALNAPLININFGVMGRRVITLVSIMAEVKRLGCGWETDAVRGDRGTAHLELVACSIA